MTSIAAIASGDARFNILVSALQFVDSSLPGTNLLGTLSSPGANLTVFAPTDAAFGQLAKDAGFTGNISDEAAVTAFLVTALPATVIRDVILYHVSAGAKTLAEIAANPTVSTLNGQTITADGITLTDKEPDLINPSLVQTDIAASNGIVHVIDRVLLPIDLPGNDAPTISGIVAASGDFDTNKQDFDLLLKAVQAAGLADTLNNPAADLTVFAPNDAAFMNLAKTLGFKGTTEADAFAFIVDALTLLSGGGSPIPLLTDILLYHVAPESLQASQVLSSTSITTVLGTSLGVSGTSLVDGDPDLANPGIIATDIQAANGVVHVIDGVLIPVDILKSDSSRGVDFIIAGDRTDFIHTGRDNDFVDGNGGNDIIFGGRGNDVLLGGTGNDVLFGNRNNDTIKGDDGRDVIHGGSGNDVITGGAGFDLLLGNAGMDTFVFTKGSQTDRIFDFRNGTDKIDLRAFGITDFTDLAHAIHGQHGLTVIDLGNGDKIELVGIRVHQLESTDFLFA
ncbi:MAG: fasciclin domain-containing protein [Paracoccaceae bacterium]